MATELVTHLVGIAAGVLVLAVGAFVLVAKPHSWLHRLFFLLALMDGASTILYDFSAMASGAEAQLLLRGLYWYGFIAFMATLVIFGLIFPLPFAGFRRMGLVAGLVAAAAMALGVLYARRHDLFWVLSPEGRFLTQPLGNVLNAAFVAATATLVVRLTHEVRAGPSESHGRQAAYVLGGMTLAYAPYAMTNVVGAVARSPRLLVEGRGDIVFAYWSFVALALVLVGSAIALVRTTRPERRDEANFVLASYAGVLALALATILFPTAAAADVLQVAALTAYPLLLAWAVVRYEVFDIDRHLRRVATLTILGAALAASFVIAQNVLESLLQQQVFGSLDSEFVAGSVAAIATALLSIPVGRLANRLGRRIVPELTMDELHTRKLDIYEHSLAGAYADGILEDRESRTLAALRASLGITDREHDQLVARLRARMPSGA